jgi:serine phosphatase RsbU (regulator of sigma subunit)
MTSRRRIAGVLSAFVLLALIGGYEIARLRALTRSGWAGMSYIPDIRTSKGKPIDYGFAGFSPGAVVYVYPGSAAERAGITRGTHLVSINGIPLTDEAKLRALSNSAKRGDVLTYRTSAPKVADHRVRLAAPTESPFFLLTIGIAQLVALTFLAIGTFVFWRLPNDARALVFFLMTICATAWVSSGAVAQIDAQNLRGIAVTQQEATQLLRLFAFALVGVFFAPLLLHLALIFPKERPVIARRGRTLFFWIYGFPIYVCAAALALSALMLLPEYMQKVPQSKAAVQAILMSVAAAAMAAGAVAIYRIAMGARASGLRESFITRPLAVLSIVLGLLSGGLWIAFIVVDRSHSPFAAMIAGASVALVTGLGFAAYPVFTFVALLRSYRESDAEQRRQVKWPLWGTMVAVGGKILMSVVGIAIGSMFMMRADLNVSTTLMSIPDIASKFLYLLIPIAFAFAILKYRLMNIDVIIRRTVLYSILSAVVFVLYGVLVVGVGTMLVHFAGVQNQTMVIASTIVVALVAVPLRNRLQGLVDRNLFREKRDYPLALREIADLIGRADIESFLARAAEHVQRAMQTEFIMIALRSEKQFVISAKVGLADEVVQQFRIATSSIDLTGPLTAERNNLPPELRRLGAVTAVPVSIHRDALGFIAAGQKLSHEQLNDDDVDFLASAAAQIALSIENSRLRTEEAEFAQARAIQQVLLPTQFPKLEGFTISGKWQPARSVGGDYFDTLALGGSKAAVCIADVAGKGMPAALLMANLQAAVKATAGADVSPSRLCEKVKRVVVDNLGSKFISFFYGILDAGSRTFTYSNAGHNAPIVARADGSIERLTTGGPVFGRLFLGDAHEEATITIAPGDRVVLFTDGASEARRDDDEFGEERLASVVAANRHLTAAALLEKIADELSSFSGGNHADDVTLVVIAAD